jgi:nucleotide-binding universal stress UspA family protein
LGAQFLVIHVTEAPRPFVAEALAVDPRIELVERATDEIAKLLSKLKMQAEVAVVSGSVTEETYNRAMEFAADLLIIGRHAAKGIVGRLHPHAYAIIRQSLCPVISI